MNLYTLSRLILQLFVHMLLDRVEQRVEQLMFGHVHRCQVFGLCMSSSIATSTTHQLDPHQECKRGGGACFSPRNAQLLRIFSASK